MLPPIRSWIVAAMVCVGLSVRKVSNQCVHSFIPRFRNSSFGKNKNLKRATQLLLLREYSATMPAETASTSYPTEMTKAERYLFDLNGYIVVRGVLTPEEVEEANDVIDSHAHEMIERSDNALRNAVKDTKLYGTGPARKDLGKVLEWGKESKIFKSVLAHPRLVPL